MDQDDVDFELRPQDLSPGERYIRLTFRDRSDSTGTGGEDHSSPRVVTNEGAGTAPGADTVIGLAIIASVVALGFLCSGLIDLMACALPAIVGIAAGVAAFQTGAGVVGGAVVGLTTAALTLAAGRFAIETSRSAAVRRIVALLFVMPAAYVGYGVVLNLMLLGGASSVIWQQLIALSGGAVVGTAAWTRVTTPVPPEPADDDATRWKAL